MYKTNKYGTVSCKTVNQILTELDRDLSKEKRKKHGSTGHNQGKKSDSRQYAKLGIIWRIKCHEFEDAVFQTVMSLL